MKPDLKLFNVLSGSKEPFLPENIHDVNIFCCGPSMDDMPKLGQVRTYVFMDVLRRILRHHLGYGVRLVMNIKDLNDTISSIGGIPAARHYERIFFKTMNLLNVERPDFTPRVTDCLEMAKHVSRRCLIEEIAYRRKLDFGTICFNTEAHFEKFGCVFNPHFPPQPPPGESTRENSGEGKSNPRDFALWKSSKQWVDGKGKIRNGMPESETECASMAMCYFPEHVDILLGTKDLQFIHHQNEIALIRAYSDEKEFVRFCLCTDRVETKERATIDRLIHDKFSPLAIRYMLLKHPYDKPMIFNKTEMKKAQSSYDNLIYRINQIKVYLQKLKSKEFAEEDDLEGKWYDQYGIRAEISEINKLKQTIHDFLMDNVNVPKALERLEDYVELFSREEALRATSYEWVRYCLNYILQITDSYFGLIKCNDA